MLKGKVSAERRELFVKTIFIFLLFVLETKSNKKFKAKRFLPALEKLLKSKAKQASLFAGFHVVFQFTRRRLRVLPGLRTGLFRQLRLYLAQKENFGFLRRRFGFVEWIIAHKSGRCEINLVKYSNVGCQRNREDVY
jgi:hypothetical protein